MNNVELVFDLNDRKWTLRNGVIRSEEDVSVEIACECGNIFWIYVPDVGHRCVCGKLYRARISVDIEVVE